MKILLLHSDSKLAARESIDLWRVIRPFAELAKHSDIEIDHRRYLLESLVDSKNSRLEASVVAKECEQLAKYDIVWSSYFPDAVLFDVMQFVSLKFGTKFVIDIDDDVFHIPAHNSIWNTAGYEGIKSLQYIAENADFLVTSTPVLQAELAKHRSKPTYLLPNYIGSDYKHKPLDNGDRVVISFFGSITHAKDLEDTGCLKAIEKLVNKYPQVHFGTVGLKVRPKVPEGTYTFYPGKPGQAWLDEVWPNINADIAIAPIVDNKFNRCRSNIKWQETALIPAAFIGSNIPPYKDTVINGKTGLLVENNEKSWYKALEKLVLDKELRLKLAKSAQKEVEKNWLIKNNWQKLQEILDQVASA